MVNVPEQMQRWERVSPTEQNGFCLFSQELEVDPLVFFHATPKRNLNSIAASGFRSAAELGIGTLTSVSYAKQSSSCITHFRNVFPEDYVVFAVKFESLQQQGIADNPSDIHVYKPELQPLILGYCEMEKGFSVYRA